MSASKLKKELEGLHSKALDKCKAQIQKIFTIAHKTQDNIHTISFDDQYDFILEDGNSNEFMSKDDCTFLKGITLEGRILDDEDKEWELTIEEFDIHTAISLLEYLEKNEKNFTIPTFM